MVACRTLFVNPYALIEYSDIVANVVEKSGRSCKIQLDVSCLVLPSVSKTSKDGAGLIGIILDITSVEEVGKRGRGYNTVFIPISAIQIVFCCNYNSLLSGKLIYWGCATFFAFTAVDRFRSHEFVSLGFVYCWLWNSFDMWLSVYDSTPHPRMSRLRYKRRFLYRNRS